MTNFDINVFISEDYSLNKEEKWIFCPYTLVEGSAYLDTDIALYKYNLPLTDEEALQLALGQNTNIWSSDEDFWIDKDSLVREFGVSNRILEWIKEVESVIDNMVPA